MQSIQPDKRTDREMPPKGPRIAERTVEETVAEMNSPPQPTPTQAEADALLGGEPASEAMHANETAEQRREREAREAKETPEERAQRQALEKQQRDARPAQNQPGYQTR